MYKKGVLATTLIASIMMGSLSACASASTGFSDTQHHWAKNNIEWALQNGIAHGYKDGTFHPDDKVTEAEFLTMLINAFAKPGDMPNSVNWSDKYYAFANQMNYVTNGGSDTAKRNNPINRQEVAELIAGTQGLDYTGDNAVMYLMDKGIAKGKNSSDRSVQSFDPTGNLTRAEAVTFIKNLKDKGNRSLSARPKISSKQSQAVTQSNPSSTVTQQQRSENSVSPTNVVDNSVGLTYPDGWTAPVLKSSWTNDEQKNFQILSNELGFEKTPTGLTYSIPTGIRNAITISGSKDGYELKLQYFLWHDEAFDKVHHMTGNYRIPVVSKELFKLYFGKEYMTIWNYYNTGKFPNNGSFTLNGREVKVYWNNQDGLTALIGYPNKPLK
ncbi:S-layer homology domain-containing protein (plasmid) [Aneurinibacillus sp. Ricciae_BoGa-3]|uniref:S-layer homology domain-containing protein n=1 Tax=Aneurinibacillus sp. Ricciae_BoGa-3 TaxID=3022697 RepID=UPI0023424997|nr:S-layer homology domain-containing protein [Aneurinibacillus sp. Ricciae_BoGa-3]WCK57395.1 S-layer homology domain-containing protein [Aneurinibacillus sp. Ricciae_BoGa-3]